MQSEKAQQTAQEWKVKRQVTVDDQPSELVVKAKVDTTKGTFRISATVTTKQISDTDDEQNKLVFEQVRRMIEQATNKAREIRQEILKAQQGTGGIGELPFSDFDEEEELDEEHAGKAPIGSK